MAWARAAARSVVTATPLPAARPSSFTTQVGPKRPSAASSLAGLSTTSLCAVGTPAAAMTSLANAFEPSMRAAAADGPKHAMPASRTASATPATSGTSGPITTRSALPLARQRGDRGRVGDVDAVGLGDRGGARVAGRTPQRRHRRIVGQREHQRMLTRAGPDHQDTHEETA